MLIHTVLTHKPSYKDRTWRTVCWCCVVCLWLNLKMYTDVWPWLNSYWGKTLQFFWLLSYRQKRISMATRTQANSLCSEEPLRGYVTHTHTPTHYKSILSPQQHQQCPPKMILVILYSYNNSIRSCASLQWAASCNEITNLRGEKSKGRTSHS